MKLILYGSGEFTDSVNVVDQYLIDRYDIKSVAVIPTAAGKEKDVTNWFKLAEAHFKALDISMVHVPIFNIENANNKSLVALIDRVDWIFFSGGDPNYLLESVQGSLLWDKVYERYNDGVLLAGSSAGAMIMGAYVLAQPFRSLFLSTSTSWKKAFGLVNYNILPHYDRFKQHTTIMKRLLRSDNQTPRLGIDEDTAMLFDGDEQKILGKGTVAFLADTYLITSDSSLPAGTGLQRLQPGA